MWSTRWEQHLTAFLLLLLLLLLSFIFLLWRVSNTYAIIHPLPSVEWKNRSKGKIYRWKENAFISSHLNNAKKKNLLFLTYFRFLSLFISFPFFIFLFSSAFQQHFILFSTKNIITMKLAWVFKFISLPSSDENIQNKQSKT